MKRYHLKAVFLVTFIISFLLINGIPFAHPPSVLNVAYDTDTKLLTIKVLHNVSDPNGDHFINEIKVKLNGKDMVLQNFNSQSSSGEQDAQYIFIDAKPGDVIEILAVCNKFGDKTATINVE